MKDSDARTSGVSLMTAQEVALLLNIQVSTVYAAAADGRLPSVRLWEGKRRALLRFRRDEVDRLVHGPSTDACPCAAHTPKPSRAEPNSTSHMRQPRCHANTHSGRSACSPPEPTQR